MDRSRTFLASVKRLLFTMALPIILMVVLGVAGSLLVTFFNYNGIHDFTGRICLLVILLIVFAAFLLFHWISNKLYLAIILIPAGYFLFRGRFIKSVSWILILLSIFASCLLQLERRSLDASLPYMEFVKLNLDGSALKCKESANSITGGKKLARCRHFVFDNAIWFSELPNEKEIVYDSGDELLLPEKQRSEEWLQTAEKLDLRSEGVRKGCPPFTKQDGTKTYVPVKPPVMLDRFSDILPLGDHFYYLSLSNGG